MWGQCRGINSYHHLGIVFNDRSHTCCAPCLRCKDWLKSHVSHQCDWLVLAFVVPGSTLSHFYQFLLMLHQLLCSKRRISWQFHLVWSFVLNHFSFHHNPYLNTICIPWKCYGGLFTWQPEKFHCRFQVYLASFVLLIFTEIIFSDTLIKDWLSRWKLCMKRKVRWKN